MLNKEYETITLVVSVLCTVDKETEQKLHMLVLLPENTLDQRSDVRQNLVVSSTLL